MNSQKTKKLVFTALFTALCCVGTMVIKIPTPMGGYIHVGDAMVLLSALLLGPFYGAFAAGVGSALADLISGYFIYVPATLIIKASVAVVAALLMRALRKRSDGLSTMVSGVFAEVIMVLGYFGFEALFLGFGLAAVVDIPTNIMQGAFGAVAASLLYVVLTKSYFVRQLIAQDAGGKRDS